MQQTDRGQGPFRKPFEAVLRVESVVGDWIQIPRPPNATGCKPIYILFLIPHLSRPPPLLLRILSSFLRLLPLAFGRRNPNPSSHLGRRHGEQQRFHRVHLRHR